MRAEFHPWIEKLQQPPVLVAGIGLIAFLLLALLFVSWRWGIAADRLEMLQKRAAEGFLQAPSSTRTIRVDPRETRRISIDGGGFPQRIDLLVNARSENYQRFRVSLLRDDGTLILHADRMIRDSNNDLRLSFNTSVLPNGQYRVRVEGQARNGDMVHFAEAQMLVSGK